MHRATKLTTTTIAALALVLGLAACGSSGSDADDAKSTTTEATSGGDETTTTASDDDTDTTEADDDTTTTVVATGGGEFCEELAAYINDPGMADVDPTDPASYEKSIKESAEKSKELFSKAPDELDDSVAVLVELQENLIEELEKVDYDFMQLPPDALSAMDDPQLEAANEELTAYLEDTCGIEMPDAPEVEAPDMSTEPVTPSGN